MRGLHPCHRFLRYPPHRTPHHFHHFRRLHPLLHLRHRQPRPPGQHHTGRHSDSRVEQGLVLTNCHQKLLVNQGRQVDRHPLHRVDPDLRSLSGVLPFANCHL